MKIGIELIEIAGFASALATLRLPYGLEMRSGYVNENSVFHIYDENGKCSPIPYMSTSFGIHEKDLELMQKLVLRGDEHAKFARLINVFANITAPRWFWQEMVTYEVGVTKGCSNSTMHQECKDLSGIELEKAKDEIKEGTLQTRTYMMSYQALRRIYFQRRDHRLPIWHEFCEFIESLPLSKELITIEK